MQQDCELELTDSTGEHAGRHDEDSENDDETNLGKQQSANTNQNVLMLALDHEGSKSHSPLSRNVSDESYESDRLIEFTSGKTDPSGPEKVGTVTTAGKISPRHGPQVKPGVILLGRGNSFSLGRSEVILLHNRPSQKAKNSPRENGDRNLRSIQEQANHPSSPPPISDDVSSDSTMPRANGWHGLDTPSDRCHDDDGANGREAAAARSLQQLWQKAEEVMAAREGRVLKVLEDFGIGGLAGGGGDEDGLREEEQVWQVVQENFCSQR